jgi:ferrous iron transport protein A
MNITTTLDKLENGKRGRVVSLFSKDHMRRRLQDIGLIVGTEVECVQKSPMGDPIAYLIRGAVVAIRTEDLEDIVIEHI